MHVIRVDGRCYLRNGFHRVRGLLKAGATHIPCVLLEGTDFAQVGAVGGGATFERACLESKNPPTCGHFTDERAYAVTLRQMSRLIHITWSMYECPDDL